MKLPLVFSARYPPRAGIFFILLGLAACAAPQARIDNEYLPRQVELTAVPFFPQRDYQCGPAALAMALNAAGAKATPEQLKPEVYLPWRKGSLQVEMLAGARRQGFVAYPLSSGFPDLLADVAGGAPVIVLQNLGLSWYPVWHYAVVVGYDLDRQEIVLRSGEELRQILSLNTFLRTWQRSGFWAMLALPPDKLPASVSEQAYLSAVLALEKSGQLNAARSAYQTPAARWPDNPVALIGLGNIHHALGNLTEAEAAFRSAVLKHPESAAAFNNLAQTLADQGRREEALLAARRAVELGGTHLAASLATLRSIETQGR
ncbi:MAG TPA: PA2778 family cysteine peptidase [Burkholderiales bacterium]|nr:PA2778 family cysteine peptidase [Burkholderiales bacterium]